MDHHREAGRVRVAALDSVVEASASAMAVLSLDGRFVTVNAAYADLVGRPVEDLVGASFTTLTHPDDVRGGLEVVEAIGRGEPSARLRKRYVRDDGEVVWVDVVVSALSDGAGGISGLLSQVQPAEGPTAEQVTLTESEARFRAAMDNAPIGMAVVGLDGEWLQVNRVLCAILGRTPADLSRLGLRLRDVMDPDDFHRDLSIRRDLARGRSSWARGTRRLLRRDDSSVWCDMTVTVIRGSSGEPVHLLLHVIELSDSAAPPSLFGEAHHLSDLAAESEDLLYYRLQLQPELQFEHVSDSVERLCGHTAQEFYGDPRLIFDIIHPEDAPQLLSLLTDPDVAARKLEFRWRHRDGHEVVTTSRHSSVRKDGAALALEGILVDITRQRDAEHARSRSDAWFRSLVQNSIDAVIVTDLDGRVSYATPSVERILQWPPEDVLGATVWDHVHPDDVGKLRLAFAGSSRTLAMRMRNRSGQWRWLEAVVTDLSGDPAVQGVVINARDIHDQRTAEEALRVNAVTDGLTRLPNRALVEDRIGRTLLRNRADPTAVAVFTLDLDRFGAVNDALGHRAADTLLVEVGARLVAATPASHTVGRFAADEFVVCGEGFSDLDAVRRYADALRAALAGPIDVDGDSVRVDASVGVAVADDVGVTAAELLRRSVSAVRNAKDAGGATVAFHDPSSAGRAKVRAHREHDLLGAAERDELVAHYQPIVDLDTGRLVAAEALVRWQHPLDGLVPPDEFIGIAEVSGAIIQIGAWMIDEACTRASTWRALPGMGDFSVAVNLAARQLADPTTVDLLAETLERHRLPTSALTVEVTESAALGHGHLQTLRQIDGLGIPIALDDFGTHYSSLSYLQLLPVCHLKIDRSFVTGIASDRQRRAIVMATAQLGRALRLTTTAEGIEDAREASELHLLGIDRGQGYLFGRPMPADDLTELLRSGPLPLA